MLHLTHTLYLNHLREDSANELTQVLPHTKQDNVGFTAQVSHEDELNHHIAHKQQSQSSRSSQQSLIESQDSDKHSIDNKHDQRHPGTQNIANGSNSQQSLGTSYLQGVSDDANLVSVMSTSLSKPEPESVSESECKHEPTHNVLSNIALVPQLPATEPVSKLSEDQAWNTSSENSSQRYTELNTPEAVSVDTSKNASSAPPVHLSQPVQAPIAIKPIPSRSKTLGRRSNLTSKLKRALTVNKRRAT